MTDNEIRLYDGMTTLNQLDLYRNLYYCNGLASERGIIANAINDIIVQFNRQKAEIERLEKDREENFEMWKKLCEQTEEKHEKMFQEAKATIRPKAIKEFAEKIDELLKRYAHLHKRADEVRCCTEEYADGTPMEMVSVWEVLSLKKWEMADYENMNALQDNIETIAIERLLTEIEKDFKLLEKEMVGDAE